MNNNEENNNPKIVPLVGQFESGSVSYYKNGNISHGNLNYPTKFLCGDIDFTFQREISFFYSGQVYSGFLYGDHSVRIGDNDFILSGDESKGYDNISFYEDGKIMSCNLQGHQTVSIGGNSFRVYSYPGHEDYYSGDIVVFYSDIHFHPNGAIQEFKLASDSPCAVGNLHITFRGWNNIYFHDNGVVAQGLSANEVTINGKTYFDNYGERVLLFSREGEFLGCKEGW